MAKKNDAGRMQYMIDYMKSHPSAAYADVHSAAKSKGYEIFPIMFGRVQKLLGRVGKGAGKAAKPAAKAAAAPAAAPKRRGRPPGSKNKSGMAAAVEASAPAAAPKRRGRPPGSKNKPKFGAVAAPAAASVAAPKRRGRPPGSKNRPKGVAVAAPAPMKVSSGNAIALSVNESDMSAWRQLVGGVNAGKTLALQFDGSRWVVLFV